LFRETVLTQKRPIIYKREMREVQQRPHLYGKYVKVVAIGERKEKASCNVEALPSQ